MNTGTVVFAPDYESGKDAQSSNGVPELVGELTATKTATYPDSLLDQLRRQALRAHVWMPTDCGSSCPKADGASGVCNCGAETHNAQVENLYQQLKRASRD